ncbi:hypothetical protein [Pelobacter propionicus]|uniref:Uncharacterized protein n=1 Tax=Pelobacter propionicus (strain DSM 2379 / NBRC 103807 / OttBd1) TaxID=338966 RepID=A1ATJ7_PELPD|nr:hypothetical protein [Pelobacter propionicus]ABL00668.1 hypothetical protein Ppro_3072 [Pelobacter propionicus DSM 2379]
MKNDQIETLATKRSSDLNANFIDGFADGWFMALKESYKMELDIKLTERKKNKISYYEWTQGPYYCFSEGQIIYDIREAHTCWREAIKKVNIACQIVAAKPNIPIKIADNVKGKTKFSVLEGYVKFILFKPDKERTKLIPHVCYNLSQNNFVNYLKTGNL